MQTKAHRGEGRRGRARPAQEAGGVGGRVEAVAPSKTGRRRRWRDYRTSTGGRPVKEFLDQLADAEVAAIVAAMTEVAADGLRAAKHLRGDVYEVRADGPTRTFRVLFAAEGRFGQVLLTLSGFVKKTQKTPPRELARAESRLVEWRERGAAMRKQARHRGSHRSKP
jgi:phage-related protein